MNTKKFSKIPTAKKSITEILTETKKEIEAESGEEVKIQLLEILDKNKRRVKHGKHKRKRV